MASRPFHIQAPVLSADDSEIDKAVTIDQVIRRVMKQHTESSLNSLGKIKSLSKTNEVVTMHLVSDINIKLMSLPQDMLNFCYFLSASLSYYLQLCNFSSHIYAFTKAVSLLVLSTILKM